MTESPKNNPLPELIVGLFLKDCLDYHNTHVNDLGKLTKMLFLEYGAIYTHDGKIYHTESISTPIGSDDIHTEEHGHIAYGDYMKINGVPQFVNEITEAATGDLLTAVFAAGYPVSQITSSGYVHTSDDYTSRLDEIYYQIMRYLNFVNMTNTTEKSKIQNAIDTKQAMDEYAKSLGDFLNAE